MLQHAEDPLILCTSRELNDHTLHLRHSDVTIANINFHVRSSVSVGMLSGHNATHATTSSAMCAGCKMLWILCDLTANIPLTVK